MAELTDIRKAVRERYASAAKAAAAATPSGCCSPADATGVFGGALYEQTDEAPEAALNASLGCGVPTAVADLHAGEVVLDLGSGAGADVLISARRAGPTGRVRRGRDPGDPPRAPARRRGDHSRPQAGVRAAVPTAGFRLRATAATQACWS